MVRREDIRWLKLPKRGVTLEFYHSPIAYGGLGIRSFRGTQLDLNKQRLTLLKHNTDPFTRWLLHKSHWSQRLSDPTNDPRNNLRQRPAKALESSDNNSGKNSQDTRQADFASVRYKPEEEDTTTSSCTKRSAC